MFLKIDIASASCVRVADEYLPQHRRIHNQRMLMPSIMASISWRHHPSNSTMTPSVSEWRLVSVHPDDDAEPGGVQRMAGNLTPSQRLFAPRRSCTKVVVRHRTKPIAMASNGNGQSMLPPVALTIPHSTKNPRVSTPAPFLQPCISAVTRGRSTGRRPASSAEFCSSHCGRYRRALHQRVTDDPFASPSASRRRGGGAAAMQ